jgi:hypothetical protein
VRGSDHTVEIGSEFLNLFLFCQAHSVQVFCAYLWCVCYKIFHRIYLCGDRYVPHIGCRRAAM